MENEKHSERLCRFAIAAMLVVFIMVACSPQSAARPIVSETAPRTPAPTNTLRPTAQATSTSASNPSPTSQFTPAPTDAWFALLQRTPFPYTTPLPPPTRTVIDGTYAKLDPKQEEHVPCKRCPDYAPEGGIWKLHLDGGVYRIFYENTGWRSIASFTVSGDQFALFDDPYCTDVVGRYTWKLEKGVLTLKVIEDDCAIRLRAMNLTSLPWLACRPPNTEAAVTDHWLKPSGCQ